MGLYSVLYKNCILSIALIGWAMLSLFYLLITCNTKPEYLREIDNIRKDHLEELELEEED
jgi:hypothetical protein